MMCPNVLLGERRRKRILCHVKLIFFFIHKLYKIDVDITLSSKQNSQILSHEQISCIDVYIVHVIKMWYAPGKYYHAVFHMWRVYFSWFIRILKSIRFILFCVPIAWSKLTNTNICKRLINTYIIWLVITFDSVYIKYLGVYNMYV